MVCKDNSLVVTAISNQGFPAQKCQESQEIAENLEGFFYQKVY